MIISLCDILGRLFNTGHGVLNQQMSPAKSDVPFFMGERPTDGSQENDRFAAGSNSEQNLIRSKPSSQPKVYNMEDSMPVTKATSQRSNVEQEMLTW